MCEGLIYKFKALNYFDLCHQNNGSSGFEKAQIMVESPNMIINCPLEIDKLVVVGNLWIKSNFKVRHLSVSGQISLRNSYLCSTNVTAQSLICSKGSIKSQYLRFDYKGDCDLEGEMCESQKLVITGGEIKMKTIMTNILEFYEGRLNITNISGSLKSLFLGHYFTIDSISTESNSSQLVISGFGKISSISHINQIKIVSDAYVYVNQIEKVQDLETQAQAEINIRKFQGLKLLIFGSKFQADEVLATQVLIHQSAYIEKFNISTLKIFPPGYLQTSILNIDFPTQLIIYHSDPSFIRLNRVLKYSAVSQISSLKIQLSSSLHTYFWSDKALIIHRPLPLLEEITLILFFCLIFIFIFGNPYI